jgi:hypothetical protein
MSRPVSGSFIPAFDVYIQKVHENDLHEAFKNQQEIVDHFFDSIPEEKHDYAYAPGKWTLKEMLQHLIDSERIFNYRSLCFARHETASLPGFEENDYAANSNAKDRTWESLCSELKAVRKASIFLYESFTDEMLLHPGVANNNPSTALALGFDTVGHAYHHVYVIETKYLEAAESC